MFRWPFHRRWLPGLCLAAMCVIGLPSCGKQAGVSKPTPPSISKIAIIRLGGEARTDEPSEEDITGGLRQEGMAEKKSYTILALDAQGDASRLPDLIDTAVKEGASLVIAVHPVVVQAAAERLKTVPLVTYTGVAPPAAVGLAKTGGESSLKVAGVYFPFEQSNLVSIAATHFPANGRRLGIIFNPDDPVSVACKNALLVTDQGALRDPPTFELAEARSSGDLPAAIRGLAERKTAALLLVPAKGVDSHALIEEATRSKIPVFGYTAEQAKAGAVMVRFPRPRWGGFEAARLAARILKDQKSQNLAFKGISEFGTIANKTAAQKVGLTIRGEFLRTAEILP